MKLIQTYLTSSLKITEVIRIGIHCQAYSMRQIIQADLTRNDTLYYQWQVALRKKFTAWELCTIFTNLSNLLAKLSRRNSDSLW